MAKMTIDQWEKKYTGGSGQTAKAASGQSAKPMKVPEIKSTPDPGGTMSISQWEARYNPEVTRYNPAAPGDQEPEKKSILQPAREGMARLTGKAGDREQRYLEWTRNPRSSEEIAADQKATGQWVQSLQKRNALAQADYETFAALPYVSAFPDQLEERRQRAERTQRELDAAQKRVLKLEEEQGWAKRYGREAREEQIRQITKAPDFEEKSRYVSTRYGDPVFNDWTGQVQDTGYGDILYDYINGDENARATVRAQELTVGADMAGIDSEYLQHMTEDEVGIYNYLYRQDQENHTETAKEYLEYISSELYQKQRESQQEAAAKEARKHPVKASVASVLLSPMKGMSFIGQVADYLEDGKIDQNAGYNKYSYIPAAQREGISKLVKDHWGPVGSFLYQTGMSMADFLFNTGVTGGKEWLSLAIMGAGAAADGVIEAKDRGLSDKEAFILGSVAGAAEIVTEKVSLEALLNPDWEKGALVYILKNALSEGSEEVASDLVNTLADVLIAQDKSKWRTAVNAYMAQGMSEKEAMGRAVKDQAMEMGIDFLGGALSGGVMAAGGAGLNALNAKMTGNSIIEGGNRQADTNALIDIGLRSEEGTMARKLAQFAKEKTTRGETLTPFEIGQLWQADARAMDADKVTMPAERDLSTGIHALDEVLGLNTSSDSDINNLSRNDEGALPERFVTGNGDSPQADSAPHASTIPQPGPGVKPGPVALLEAARDGDGRLTVENAMRAMAEAARNGADGQELAALYRSFSDGSMGYLADENGVLQTAEERETAARREWQSRQLDRALSAFGPEGQQMARELTRGSPADPAGFYNDFASAYEAGLSGLPLEQVRSVAAGALTAEQTERAWLAGQRDAGSSLARERGRAESAVIHDRAGAEVSGETAQQAAALDRMAKALGVRVQLADTIPGRNGLFDPEAGTITLARDAEHPMLTVAAHELTHRIQELAPEAYREYRDYAVRTIQERSGESGTNSPVDALREAYRRAGVEITAEEAMDELAADFTREMIENEALFAELTRERRSLARRLLDGLKELLHKLGSFIRGDAEVSREMAQLQGAAERWQRAYDSAAAVAGELETKNPAGDGGTKYSIMLVDGQAMTVIDTENDTRDYRVSEKYLETLVDADNPFTTILRDAQEVYIGKDLPGEYTHSEYSKALRSETRKVKMQAATNLDEMLLLAENGEWRENVKEKHQQDAKNGWYRYQAEFAVPIKARQLRGGLDHYSVYSATLLIRNDADGRSYLYDLLDLDKKREVSASAVSSRFRDSSVFEAGTSREETIAQTGQNVKTKYSLKQYSEAEKNAHVRTVLNHFGETSDWNEAGYLTRNGKLTDFSGRHWGGTDRGVRQVDHRDITEALGVDYGGDDYSGSMVQFMGEGNIRLAPETNGINLSVAPTASQLRRLSTYITRARGEVILDLDTPGGDTVCSVEYPKGTSAQKVLQDIKQYFEDGTEPQVSDLSRFRYSLKDTGDIAQRLRAAEAENRRLRERMEYWKGQTKLTEEITTDSRAVRRTARELLQSTSSRMDAGQLNQRLQSLYDYIARGGDQSGELTGSEARKRAREIARDLAESAVETDDGLYQEYKDLRKYLRETRLSISPEDAANIADFNDFRRKNFGRLRIGSGDTNIDQVYMELSEMWPEVFDAERETHPADQLLRISEVMDGVYSVTEANPFSGSMREAVDDITRDILERFFDLPQTQPTRADRLAEQFEREIAERRNENDRRIRDAIQAEREARGRELDRLRRRYEARDAKARERQEARQLRSNIQRVYNRLSRRLLTPSDKLHIPENMRRTVAAALESVNLEGSWSIDPETGRRTKGFGDPTKRTETFRELRELIAAVQEEGSSTIDPELFGDKEQGFQGLFEEVLSMRDIRTEDMTPDQLKTVLRTLQAVEGAVTNAGKVLGAEKYQHTVRWADALARDTKSRRRKHGQYMLDMETPYTYFSHFGKPGMAIYRMLRNAQDAEQVLTMRAAEEIRGIVDSKTVKRLESEVHTYTTEAGVELTLTTAHLMDLYELAKRRQAEDHLLKGGIVQPEIEAGSGHRKVPRGNQAVLLSSRDLLNLTGLLTKDQTALADKLQAVTRGTLAEMGNEASMKAYGYRKFTEADYWPIRASRDTIRKTAEKGDDKARSVRNTGMAKRTVAFANNPLELRGIFRTLSDHVSDMVNYSAWLCPMENAEHLLNHQFKDAEGNKDGRTVQGILKDVAGEKAVKYWTDLMEDIQNGIKGQNDSYAWDLAGKMVGGFKGAAVGGNIRVVIQQPTAFFRAGAVLSPLDMARGLAGGATGGNGWKKALQYSPIAMRKDAGGFDIASPVSMRDTLYDTKSGVQRVNDALGWAAGKADAVTWGALWNASEWQVARNRKDLKKGSDSFYKAVNEVFSDMIDQTQVVDGVLQRSNIMRSSNAVVQQATSFMGEPIMSYNLMARSWDQFRYETDRTKKRQALGKMGRAAAALLVTNVVNALAQSLVDAERDKDMDGKYLDKLQRAFIGLEGDEDTWYQWMGSFFFSGNLGGNLNPLDQFPFVKDVLSLAQGYDVSRSEMEIVSDLVTAGKLCAKVVTGESTRTPVYAVRKLIEAGARFWGLPVANILREVEGFTRLYATETDNLALEFEIEKFNYSLGNSKNKSRFTSILYRALEQGDFDSYEHIRRVLMEEMGVDGKSIDEDMRRRYRAERDEDPGYTLSERACDIIGSVEKLYEAEKPDTFDESRLGAVEYNLYTKDRADRYRESVDAMERCSAYRAMDQATKDKAVAAAYDLAKATALRDNSDGAYEIEAEWMSHVEELKDAGIEPWQLALFHVGYNTVEKTRYENGKPVKGEEKRDHFRRWLEEFEELGEDQRRILWGLVYKEEW